MPILLRILLCWLTPWLSVYILYCIIFTGPPHRYTQSTATTNTHALVFFLFWFCCCLRGCGLGSGWLTVEIIPVLALENELNWMAANMRTFAFTLIPCTNCIIFHGAQNIMVVVAVAVAQFFYLTVCCGPCSCAMPR